MELHKPRVIAAGVLCAMAATVTVWSGPLASASQTFHTAATTPTPVHVHVHVNADRSR
jgi:hypothetical protein